MIFRMMLKKFLQGRGFTREQSNKLVEKIDWSKVRQIIKEYGPILLKIFLALLPLFILMEQPALVTEAGDEKQFEVDFQDYMLVGTEPQ